MTAPDGVHYMYLQQGSKNIARSCEDSVDLLSARGTLAHNSGQSHYWWGFPSPTGSTPASVQCHVPRWVGWAWLPSPSRPPVTPLHVGIIPPPPNSCCCCSPRRQLLSAENSYSLMPFLLSACRVQVSILSLINVVVFIKLFKMVHHCVVFFFLVSIFIIILS